MIIKGASRGNAGQLSRYLMNAQANDRVAVLELPPLAPDVAAAIRDMERVAVVTQGRKPLYHAQINPEPGYAMTANQWQRAVDVLGENLGLNGQPRAVVLHEKDGRTHAHVVFQRTDIEREVLLSDSFTRYKHMAASRQLERELGHRQTSEKKREAVYTQEEARKAANDRLTPREVKAVVTEIYRQSETAESFRETLQAKGYDIAVGDRRAFALLDRYGQDYNLVRMVKGARTSELKDFLAPVEPDLEMQDVYQGMIEEYLDLHIKERAEATEVKQAAARRRLYQRMDTDLERSEGGDQKQEVMVYYRDRSQTLRQQQGAERRQWEALDRFEKIRQIQEEQQRQREMEERERRREQGRGLSL